jgi:hypothetical protein
MRSSRCQRRGQLHRVERDGVIDAVATEHEYFALLGGGASDAAVQRRVVELSIVRRV